MKIGKFEIKEKVIEDMKREQVRKERLIFLALCPETDRLLIRGQRELTLDDFNRISYLLESLGLTNYCVTFEMEHSDLLRMAGRDIIEEQRFLDKRQIDVEFCTYIQWIKDFCNQLPTPEITAHLKELFEI